MTDLDVGYLTARVAHELLDIGPMGDTIRGDDYEAFLESTWGRGKQLRKGRTSCGIFAGACWIAAGVQKPRPWKLDGSWGITTWLGVGFRHRSWIPVSRMLKEGIFPEPGDVFYIASDAGQMKVGGKVYTWSRWEDALNGHVGVVGFDGSGWEHTTYEGGGSPGGTICRKSAAPKNLLKMGRKTQGFWRPSLIVANGVT